MSDFSRKAPTTAVFIGDGSGSLREDPLLQPLRIEWSTGGKRLDFAEIELDHGKSKATREAFRKWIKNDFYEGHEVQIKVTIKDTTSIAHVGRLAQMKIQVGEKTERLILVSRMEKWHFGKPLVGIRSFSPRLQGNDDQGSFGSRFNSFNIDIGEIKRNETVQLHDTIMFNPDRDGTVYGSRVDPSTTRGAVFAPANLIGSPRGLLTYPERDFWELADVLFYLCQNLNDRETVIKNPPLDEIERQIGAAKGLIRNLHLPHGIYLPEALDKVCDPLGYTWFLDYSDTKPRLTFFRKDKGFGRISTEANLRIPENEDEVGGFPLDLTQMNITDLNIVVDKSAVTNEVGAIGDFVEVESTFELVKAWPQEKDDLIKNTDLSDPLNINVQGTLGDNKNVWRKWVLNETGEYNDTRPEITETFNFDDIFKTGEWTESRRRFLPTITTGDNGEPIGEHAGVLVEVLNPVTETWETVTENYHRLDDECGIYFGDITPPEQVTFHGPDVRLRITATVRGDRKVSAVAPRRDESLQRDTTQLVLNMPGRFKRRVVHVDSVAGPSLVTPEPGTTAVDDFDRLNQYVVDIRERFDRPHVTGTMTFEGVEGALSPQNIVLG